MPRVLLNIATTLCVLLVCCALYFATLRQGHLYTQELDQAAAQQLRNKTMAGLPSQYLNLSGYAESHQPFPGLWIHDYVHWTATRSYNTSPRLLFIISFLAALLPARRFNLMHQRRREARADLCPICHYDLRATPGQCPECGTRFTTS